MLVLVLLLLHEAEDHLLNHHLDIVDHRALLLEASQELRVRGEDRLHVVRRNLVVRHGLVRPPCEL